MFATDKKEIRRGSFHVKVTHVLRISALKHVRVQSNRISTDKFMCSSKDVSTPQLKRTQIYLNGDVFESLSYTQLLLQRHLYEYMSTPWRAELVVLKQICGKIWNNAQTVSLNFMNFEPKKNLLNMYLTLWHHWHCWLKSLLRLRL